MCLSSGTRRSGEMEAICMLCFCPVPNKHFFLFFSQGNVENGRDLIKKGIKMREELGVPLYTAAGNCDLGSE